jgi:hypothetical protein
LPNGGIAQLTIERRHGVAKMIDAADPAACGGVIAA